VRPSGGSGGRLDAGAKGGSTGYNPDGGSVIDVARLHRSGCSCDVGKGSSGLGAGLGLPLVILGAVLLRRRRRR